MPITFPSRPHCLAALLVLAAPFLPARNLPFSRNADLDVELVRSAECEYRGITASFEELSRAYAIRVYEHSEFLGWEARPNPRHPEAEALVTGTFAVAGLQEAPPASWGKGPEIRARVRDRVALTWRLSSMTGVHVAPHDDYARDAVEVFRETVDGYLARMVYLIEPTALHSEPEERAEVVAALDIGQILLRQSGAGGWLHVRLPGERTEGWVDSTAARPVGP